MKSLRWDSPWTPVSICQRLLVCIGAIRLLHSCSTDVLDSEKMCSLTLKLLRVQEYRKHSALLRKSEVDSTKTMVLSALLIWESPY